MASRPQLLTGARGVIDLTRTTDAGPVTKTVAFSTDITINVRHTVKQTFTIGDMNASAIDSISYDVDVSVGRVVPVTTVDADSSVQNGAPPSSGAALQEGSIGGTGIQDTTISAIAIGFEEVLNLIRSADDIVIRITDRNSGMDIGRVSGCRFSGRSMTMNAGDTATERLNFTGIYDAGMKVGAGPSDNSATDGYGV